MLRVLIGAALVLGLAAPAVADRVDSLSRRLASSRSTKVRLSAALGLARVDDARAVTALARALGRDRDSTVRRVAAATLPRLLGTPLPSRVRTSAMRALRRAARGDRDRDVRRTASASLVKLERAPRPQHRRPARSRGNALVVHVDRPTGRVSRRGAAQLQVAVERAVKRHVPRRVHTVRGPSRGQPGYTVASKVKDVDVRRRGGRADVTCTVEVRVAPVQDGRERWRSGESAVASGTGRVATSAQRRAIAHATRDCIVTVIERVTARRVGPFLASATR